MDAQKTTLPSKKQNWFEENHTHLQVIASQVPGMAGALMYSEILEEYLKLFPGSVFNKDYAEYLRE